ncbi:MAG: hypothetical protein LH477_00795 [Nocardioides sp.]|nr:hypothetical protein [Nocardioides sp.]
MRVAGVVGREVAEDAPAAGVDGGAESGVGLVTPEQRIDLVEGGRVVAVVAGFAGLVRTRTVTVSPSAGASSET